MISDIINKHDNPVVGFSGGKDSTVVLDIVRSIDPDIVGVFCDTGIEYPSTYRYISRVDNIVTVKPDVTFFDCVEKYGWPGVKGGNNKSGYRGNACCYYLKDKPMRQYIRDNDVDLVFDGLTKAESHQRFMFLSHYGMYHFVKSWGGIWKCHPIMDWDQRDVWNYIYNHSLDYNDGYDNGMRRCGCKLCTAYCSWKEQMAKENFKLYAKVSHWKLNQMLLDGYK